jgi:hypothetical protein
MAKRLTDTEKWNDDWFISLDNDYRMIWQWLLDNCNHAGVCKRSMKLMNLMCNTNVSEEDVVVKMEGRLVVVDNNWFIPKFLKFQYASLHSQRPVIISVVKELEKLNLLNKIPESFGNDYLIIKDKRKDKDKDKDSLTSKKSKNSAHEPEAQPFSNFKAQSENLFASRMAKRKNEAD